MKPSTSTAPTISRTDPRNSPANYTSPSGLTSKVNSSDYQLQSPNLAPRLHSGNSVTDAKAHNRQTSIVHGIQHSRNGSFASSSNSPLSPQIIAAAGGEMPDASNMGDSVFASTLSSMASGNSFTSNATLVPDRPPPPVSENSSNTLSQMRVERMHSGRSSRDHRHHHSHSRHHHKEELKTVGEYALHVLFTSVSLLNPCSKQNL